MLLKEGDEGSTLVMKRYCWVHISLLIPIASRCSWCSLPQNPPPKQSTHITDNKTTSHVQVHKEPIITRLLLSSTRYITAALSP